MDRNLDALDFSDRQAWRLWLEERHVTQSKAWLLIQKKGSAFSGLSLDEAVEEALCYGWIDGKLKPRDEHSYLLRFSPRKPDSVWSMNNIRRVEELRRRGAMTEAGLSMVRIAKENGQWQAAIDREHPENIPADLESELRRAKGALAAYKALPDSQKKQILYWLQSAKREATRRKRIGEIIHRMLDEM
jgi:uncharacterized protein YdeI (YjbR/CyaY-like superfamily)